MPLQRPQNKFLACFLTRRCPYNAFAICIKRRYYFDRYAYKHIYAKVAAPLPGIGSRTVEYLRKPSYWYLRECSSTVPASLGISIQLSLVFYDRYLLQTGIIGQDAMSAIIVFNASFLTRLRLRDCFLLEVNIKLRLLDCNLN